MKKIALLFSFLLCFTLSFSQLVYLDAGPQVPADEPQGQPVLSYSFGNPGSINLTMVTGLMSPELFLAAASGTLFSRMEIKVYEQNKVIYKITLQNVMVASISTSSGATENVTLQYEKIRIKDFSH
jgi:hypothetical protein